MGFNNPGMPWPELEVRLPVGPDGHAIVEVVRAHTGALVLFVSEASSLEERLAGFEAGADDYVGKPFEIVELKARVNARSRHSRAAAARG